MAVFLKGYNAVQQGGSSRIWILEVVIIITVFWKFQLTFRLFEVLNFCYILNGHYCRSFCLQCVSHLTPLWIIAFKDSIYTIAHACCQPVKCIEDDYGMKSTSGFCDIIFSKWTECQFCLISFSPAVFLFCETSPLAFWKCWFSHISFPISDIQGELSLLIQKKFCHNFSRNYFAQILKNQNGR